MSTKIKPPHPRPCASCPYRKDVPSGVWSAEEYERLLDYDGPTYEQSMSVFLCHQQNGSLCGGWVATHDMEESLGVRMAVLLGKLSPDDAYALVDYRSPVELWSSGQEARDHGLKEMEQPGDKAVETIGKILRRRHVQPEQ